LGAPPAAPHFVAASKGGSEWVRECQGGQQGSTSTTLPWPMTCFRGTHKAPGKGIEGALAAWWSACPWPQSPNCNWNFYPLPPSPSCE
jgi:hypothetical protein